MTETVIVVVTIVITETLFAGFLYRYLWAVPNISNIYSVLPISIVVGFICAGLARPIVSAEIVIFRDHDLATTLLLILVFASIPLLLALILIGLKDSES